MENKLRQVRKNAGLTQDQLATMIGTHKQYISALERGVIDIKKIRTDTLQRICTALGCSPDDLIISAIFETDEDGNLIVDKLWLDPRYPNNIIAEINDEYFIMPTLGALNEKITTEEQLRPFVGKTVAKVDEAPQRWYVMTHCVPRKGFVVKLGRAITPEELTKLREKYNITDDDISGEFQLVKGGIYGKKYAKYYTVVQIKITNPDINPISVEEKLKEMGIEAFAFNGNFEIINIRVK